MKVLILCGGKGSRLGPVTDTIPKVMVPIGGTPLLVHLMKVYAAQGFNSFILSVGHKHEVIVDYFADKFPEWKVQIVDTGEDAGTADRIIRCSGYLGDRFLVTYGDGLANVDLARLIRTHQQSEGWATLTVVPLQSQYGVVEFGPDSRVSRFREKPLITTGCWINAGFLVFEKMVFQNWKGKSLESHVLPELARRKKLFVHVHDGFWKSMDHLKDQGEFEELCRTDDRPWERPMARTSPRSLRGSV